MSDDICRFTFVALLAVATASCVEGAHSHHYPDTPGPAISGRIDNPLGLRHEDGVLTAGYWKGGSGESLFVRVEADGTFRTHGLEPGTYALEFIRTHSSPTAAATPVSAVRFVEIRHEDVTGVVVTLQADVELEGRYRVEGTQAHPPWPPSIYVSANPAHEGKPWIAMRQVAHALPDGRFVLRNAYGPHLLDVGYERGPGKLWGPARVLLDGRDITNIPTDFSLHPNSTLEVVIPYSGRPAG
ncbi:MAG: hypothetical protein M3Q55_18020 [Acidobacteriota bacterium]|nr:hypothetical protein [Acidobacteriota bacterium]